MREIIQGDCLEELAKLASKSVDAVVTDPPYLPVAHHASRKQWQRHYSDLSPLRVFWSAVVAELRRVLKDDGHLFVFCNADSYPAFYEPTYNQFDTLRALVWDKQRAGAGHIFRHQHELIIWARNEQAKNHRDERLHTDVLRFPVTPHAQRTHPVHKPAALLAELIAPTTHEGDIVLDPFCGSGSTLEAAQSLNRDFIGIDLNPAYVAVAAHRLQLAVTDGYRA